MSDSPSFISRFVQMVGRRNDATAICFNGRVALSYAQLLDRALSIAERLQGFGAMREIVVGLAVSKSADYIAALLGTWFSGAAFVPLDPQLPSARLRFMATQSGARIIVAAAGALDWIDGLDLQICQIDSLGQTKLSRPLQVVYPMPQDLAYIIFTSGSTGEPKGVMVEHRGLVNLLDAQITAFELQPQSRVLFYLSTNFDASVSDIGTALLSGASLYIEEQQSLQPGEPLGRLMAHRGITHADLPPSLLRMMEPSQMPECLRVVIAGGEACPPAVARRWAERYRLINVYGPTEATVCSSLCRCDPVLYQQPLIGQPLANVVYKILSPDLNLAPDGAPGELFIGGIGLARGYAGRSDLTADRFIFWQNQRLYRAGDRVVRDSNGDIRFLGRLDRQVKMRGQLVEPEEIERRLMEHPSVVHAAVVKRELGAARDGLVAYLVVLDVTFGSALSHAELSEFLSRQLPKWMIPQHYECVDSLPTLSSGKTDYAALLARPIPSDHNVAVLNSSLSEQGKMLADIWKQALGVETVLAEDDFWSLGGDSLALLGVMAASEARGLRIPSAWFAERWTLSQIDARLQLALESRSDQPQLVAMSATDLEREAQFGSEWLQLLQSAGERRASVRTDGSREVFFLTGATGFLGSRLLVELLKRVDCQLCCVVRAADVSAGFARIVAAVGLHGIELTTAQQRRICAIPGDLELPRFGFSASKWNWLAREADAIYHCAAAVNLVQPYDALRRVNVDGTRQMLRLACEGKRKQFHYASTLSVLVATDRVNTLVKECDDLSGTTYVHGGYAQSKWAAERLIRAAANHAAPFSCYRLGLITGDSVTGYSPCSDHLAIFVRGLAELACAPASALDSLRLDMTPVDFAAAAMAELSISHHDALHTWHLANPSPVSLRELVGAFTSSGFHIDLVSDDQWRHRFENRFAGDIAFSPDAAAAYLSLCRSMEAELSAAFARHRTMDLFQATGVEFEMTATLAALAPSGLFCPSTGQEVLSRYVHRILDRSLAARI